MARKLPGFSRRRAGKALAGLAPRDRIARKADGPGAPGSAEGHPGHRRSRDPCLPCRSGRQVSDVVEDEVGSDTEGSPEGESRLEAKALGHARILRKTRYSLG